MQSRIVNKNIIQNYQVSFIPERNTKINIYDIINKNPIKFTYKKLISGKYKSSHTHDKVEDLKSECLNQVLNVLESRISELDLLISKYTKNHIINLFNSKYNRKYIDYQEEKCILANIIKHPESIEDNIVIVINDNILEEFINIPFYSLDVDRYVYVVVQDFNNYLDIKKYLVIDKEIQEVQLDPEFNTDYEFSYYLSDKFDNVLHIPHYSFRNFDGSKLQFNDKFLFLSVEEAQKHCLLVLESLKNNIEEKIHNIINYEE